MTDRLPTVLADNGELVRLVTSEHLLEAAGLADLAEADLQRLAEFTSDADHLAAIAREAKGAVGEEMIRRMDRRGQWTLHLDGAKVTAPSPDAGATVYDTEALRETLGRLVDDDLIDGEAALAALERVVPEPYYKQKPAGIKRLLKISAEVRAAIEACERESEPPARVARVKWSGS